MVTMDVKFDIEDLSLSFHLCSPMTKGRVTGPWGSHLRSTEYSVCKSTMCVDLINRKGKASCRLLRSDFAWRWNDGRTEIQPRRFTGQCTIIKIQKKRQEKKIQTCLYSFESATRIGIARRWSIQLYNKDTEKPGLEPIASCSMDRSMGIECSRHT